MENLLPSSDQLSALLFPSALFFYYMIVWMITGRDPKLGAVTPQYDPPPGLTPGVARYILTGGSDGTTLAAVLAGLAAKGVVSIQPEGGQYRVELVNRKVAVWPEEASLLRRLFSVESEVAPYAASGTAMVGSAQDETQPRFDGEALGSQVDGARLMTAAGPATTSATIVPRSPEVKAHLGAIQDSFRKNLAGVYFNTNFRYAGIGILATFTWGLITATRINVQSSIFLTFWLLGFSSIAGLVIGGVWTSKPTQPTASQQVGRTIVPFLFFVLPGGLIYIFAMPQAHGFVLALLLSVLLNSIFFVIMRAPTPLGQTTLQQLAGFREFLVRVEQDRLERANTPEQKAALMNRFLPYAIALNVREGWGDRMAAVFSDSIVER